MRFVPSPFAPAAWFHNAHGQTLAAALPVWPFRRSRSESCWVTVNAETALFAEMEWASEETRPTVLLVHGLGGSSRSAYVLRARRYLRALGLHTLSITLRGSGPRAAPSRTLYHAGLTDDVTAALAHLAPQARVGPILLMGFSLGGHVSLRLATQWRDNVPHRVRAVVSVSAPVDLRAVVGHLDTGSSWPPYRPYLLRALLHNVRRLRQRWPEAATLGPSDLRQIRTLRAYDEHIVAPMHGYAGADAYYEAVSCGPMLAQIRVPTLLLHAEDDPMVPWSTVEPYARAAGSALTVVTTGRGGHVGFFENLGKSARQPWPVRCAVDFFSRFKKS